MGRLVVCKDSRIGPAEGSMPFAQSMSKSVTQEKAAMPRVDASQGKVGLVKPRIHVERLQTIRACLVVNNLRRGRKLPTLVWPLGRLEHDLKRML